MSTALAAPPRVSLERATIERVIEAMAMGSRYVDGEGDESEAAEFEAALADLRKAMEGA